MAVGLVGGFIFYGCSGVLCRMKLKWRTRLYGFLAVRILLLVRTLGCRSERQGCDPSLFLHNNFHVDLHAEGLTALVVGFPGAAIGTRFLRSAELNGDDQGLTGAGLRQGLALNGAH